MAFSGFDNKNIFLELKPNTLRSLSVLKADLGCSLGYRN